jgi:hypothetical protein
MRDAVTGNIIGDLGVSGRLAVLQILKESKL